MENVFNPSTDLLVTQEKYCISGTKSSKLIASKFFWKGFSLTYVMA